MLSLSYQVTATEPTTSTPVEIELMDFSLGGFSCHLRDGVLTATPETQFTSAQDARQTLLPHLRAWQVWSLAGHGVAIEIRFTSAEISGGATEAVPQASSMEIIAHRPRPAKPTVNPPPPGLGGIHGGTFHATLRWQEVLESKESTSAGAYGVLTVLEHMYGGRTGVAKALVVSERLLSELGRLVSLGDTRSGRKVGGRPSEQRSLTNAEERSVERLIGALLYRSLVVEVGGQLGARLTAKEFPLDTFALTTEQTVTLGLRFVTTPAPTAGNLGPAARRPLAE